MATQTLFYVINSRLCAVSTDLFLTEELAKKAYDQVAETPDANISYGRLDFEADIDVNVLLNDEYCETNPETSQKYFSLIADECLEFGETIEATFSSSRN